MSRRILLALALLACLLLALTTCLVISVDPVMVELGTITTNHQTYHQRAPFHVLQIHLPFGRTVPLWV